MPKIACKCGGSLSYSEIPNSNEWLAISDLEFDKVEGKINSEDLYAKMKSFFLCPNCGRILFFWNGFQNEPISYLPEKS